MFFCGKPIFSAGNCLNSIIENFFRKTHFWPKLPPRVKNKFSFLISSISCLSANKNLFLFLSLSLSLTHTHTHTHFYAINILPITRSMPYLFLSILHTLFDKNMAFITDSIEFFPSDLFLANLSQMGLSIRRMSPDN